MINNELEYCNVVCNYLNNLKGYIEEYEIENLLWCVFGIPSEDIKEDLITGIDIIHLSSDIANDLGNDFYEDLYAIYRRLESESA